MVRGKAGKLEWVGRAIITGALTGPNPDDEVARDCALLGIDPPRDRPPEQSIWVAHLPAINALLAVSNQWRWATFGRGARVTGLDYAGVRAGLKMAGIKLTPDQWADFRVIERAAKAALNGD